MASSQPISAVIFDLFGTLVDAFDVAGHDRMTARMAERLGVDQDAFTERWVGSFPLRTIGELATTEANVLHVLAEMEASATQDAIADAVAIRYSFTEQGLTPKPGALDLLDRLRAEGLLLGLISDCSCEVPDLWPTTDFAERFDTLHFSCTEGVRKPDPEIYRRACRSLGVDPTDCLYVGDGGSRELTGAENVGMHPVLYYEAREDGDHVYRAGAEEWEGRRIEDYAEILLLLDANVSVNLDSLRRNRTSRRID